MHSMHIEYNNMCNDTMPNDALFYNIHEILVIYCFALIETCRVSRCVGMRNGVIGANVA